MYQDFLEKFYLQLPEFEAFMEDPTEKKADMVVDSIKDYYDGDKLRAAAGSTKLILIKKEFDYVIKLPFPVESGTNYCEKEWQIYRRAVEKNLDRFFAESIKCFWGDKPFYLMKKIETKEEDIRELYFKNYRLECEENGIFFDEDDAEYYYDYDYYHDYRILTVLLKEEDSSLVNRLVNFLSAYEVNDLYGNNIGLSKEKRVILFDYSGYNEE